MNTRNIPISLPYLGEEELLAVQEPLRTGWLTQGPKVAEFEAAFARYHNVKHAIAVSSCTTGLHLALISLGIGPGDEVIVPAFTWISTANVVLYCGATPVFVDVDKWTFNINPAEIADKLTKNTKAVIAVHLFGLCADIDAIREVIPEHVKIVEDAACAAGGRYKNRYAGGLTEIAAFSFHPRKIITTGEGGMITTNNCELAEIVRQLRNHGATVSEEERHSGPKPYILPDFNLLGFNYRMTDMQGAVGCVQLSKLDQLLDQREKSAAWYQEQLGEISWLSIPKVDEYKGHAWQAFVLNVDPDKAPMSRNKIMAKLQSLGISTRPGTHAVPLQNFYKTRFGFTESDFPMARDCEVNSMAIPLHNRMTEADYAYVAKALKEIA
jgi:dTDP-4-amino-4,6-dideoxygalactose transaminase